MSFDDAYERLLGHEGGYVNNPKDPGKETKYGISKKSYPQEDIKNMTLARAKALYKRDYWGPVGCDLVPAMLQFDLFDAAVNSGVTTAIQMLQRTLGVTPDGIIGPKTLIVIQSTSTLRIVARFNGYRLDYLNNLPTWPDFGGGWSQRIAENLIAL